MRKRGRRRTRQPPPAPLPSRAPGRNTSVPRLSAPPLGLGGSLRRGKRCISSLPGGRRRRPKRQAREYSAGHSGVSRVAFSHCQGGGGEGRSPWRGKRGTFALSQRRRRRPKLQRRENLAGHFGVAGADARKFCPASIVPKILAANLTGLRFRNHPGSDMQAGPAKGFWQLNLASLPKHAGIKLYMLPHAALTKQPFTRQYLMGSLVIGVIGVMYAAGLGVKTANNPGDGKISRTGKCERRVRVRRGQSGFGRCVCMKRGPARTKEETHTKSMPHVLTCSVMTPACFLGFHGRLVPSNVLEQHDVFEDVGIHQLRNNSE